ncbi:MAG: helix-turn-helix transcriptional regulator [Lachnospiraceae bacterium]|nr:helix-turn-helix transcriptional regulator [Lachnospiraceae bacterium]
MNNDSCNSNNQVKDETVITETVANNIKELLNQKKITQKIMAKDTGYAESCISDYKNGNKLPPLSFFLALKKCYGISIDDFLIKNLTPADYSLESPSSTVELEELEDFRRFEGTYYVYYLDTSSYKGRDEKSANDALMYGILHIYGTPSPVSRLDYSCIALLGINDMIKLDELRKEIDFCKNDGKAIENFITENYPDNAYYGDFSMTKKQAFISLSHRSKDKALIILHRPDSNKANYSGGIGTINSVSRGRESMPVIQFIGLSRNKTSLSPEEIHRMLLLNYPTFKSKKEAEELIATFKKLYVDTNGAYGDLTEFQKQMMIKADLEHYVRNSIRNNMFRVGKISNMDDDTWYHGLKEAFLESSRTKE